MNNINSIDRSKPEYYILKAKIKLLAQIGVHPKLLKSYFTSRFTSNPRVLKLFFPVRTKQPYIYSSPLSEISRWTGEVNKLTMKGCIS